MLGGQSVLMPDSGSSDGRFRPSDKWIAFVRGTPRQADISVTEFPAGRTWQVSVGGDAEEPMWVRNGTQLFYRAGSVRVILNWFEELKQRVPGGR